MQITSPLAGTVRFTGTVPSGDSKSGDASRAQTMNAVSIEVQNGRTITLMPLATISVKEGQRIAEGAPVGTLAASGDISTPVPHLHMGYKSGSTYYDPMLLFGASSTSASQQTQRESATDAPAATYAPETPSVSAPEAAYESTAAGAYEGAEAAEPAASEQFGTIETGAYEWQPRAVQAFDPIAALKQALSPLADACYGQFVALFEALAELSHGTGIPLPLLLGAVIVAAAVSLALILFVAIRLVASRVGKMWRNQNSDLSEAAGGDSMHKLFPASGAAFMSRSRVARGR